MKPSFSKLVGNCKEISLAPKEALFHEDDIENGIYFILEGELGVFKAPKQISIMEPGQYLGEVSLIEPTPRSASAGAEQKYPAHGNLRRKFPSLYGIRTSGTPLHHVYIICSTPIPALNKDEGYAPA